MVINGWMALVLIVTAILITFATIMIASIKHEEKMMWLKIEEIKTRWKNTGLYEKAKSEAKKRGKKNG